VARSLSSITRKCGILDRHPHSRADRPGRNGAAVASQLRTGIYVFCHACSAMSELAARTPPRLPEGQVDGPRKPDRRVSRAPARNLRLPIILVSVLVGGTILYLRKRS
jgi:hypothetical protein